MKKVKKILPQILYVGWDESNHGRFPESFAATLSYDERNLIPDTLHKVHYSPNKLFPAPIRRERSMNATHTFLYFLFQDKLNLPPQSVLGTVLSSLLRGLSSHDVSRLELFLDGEKRKGEIDFARELISETTSISKRRIDFEYGAKLDEINPLVNLADQFANFYFWSAFPNGYKSNGKKINSLKFLPREIFRDPHRRNLVY